MTILRKTQWFKRQAALVLLIMCHAANTWAQEPPNDATWEETIAFIKKNKMYLIRARKGDNEVSTILINAEKFYLIKYPSFWYDDKPEFDVTEALLRNLKAVEEYDNKHIELTFKSLRQLTYQDYSGLRSFDALDARVSEIKSLVMNMDIEKLEQLLSVPMRNKRGTELIHSSEGVDSFLQLKVNDAEMRERMVKAFEHLIYLSEKEDKF